MNMQVAVMEYIKGNHPEAAVFIGEPSEMVWSLNSSQIMVGYSRYVYTSAGWKMIIGRATTPRHVYEVRAEYDERIVWTGIVEDGEITETGYTPHCTDLNGDGEVNICDLSRVAIAFGSKEGDTNWNPKADIAEPFGEINILDLVKVVRDFGKTLNTLTVY